MTTEEILQGIDRLDAELPFDEICVGGKDNWHDIDVHELLYEARERIKEWHYPSKGELPTETDDYLVYVNTKAVRGQKIMAIATYYVGAKEWNIDTDEYEFKYPPIAWMPLPEPPKEQDNVRN